MEADVLVLVTGFTISTQRPPEDNIRATVIDHNRRHLREK